MSIHVMSWVLKNSEAKLGDRLVLLVLADHADEDGNNAWTSVATLAHEARLSERGAQYALRRLEKDGRISRIGSTHAGTHIYSVHMGANLAPSPQVGGEAVAPGGVKLLHRGGEAVAPEPSKEPSLEPSKTTYAVSGEISTLWECYLAVPIPKRPATHATCPPRTAKVLAAALREAPLAECLRAISGAYAHWASKGVTRKALADVFTTGPGTGTLSSRIAFFAAKATTDMVGAEAIAYGSWEYDAMVALRRATDQPDVEGYVEEAQRAEERLRENGWSVVRLNGGKTFELRRASRQ